VYGKALFAGPFILTRLVSTKHKEVVRMTASAVCGRQRTDHSRGSAWASFVRYPSIAHLGGVPIPECTQQFDRHVKLGITLADCARKPNLRKTC
jgi:hypothetical protein